MSLMAEKGRATRLSWHLCASKCPRHASDPKDLTQGLGSLKVSVTKFSVPQTYSPDHMLLRKLKVQTSDIEWSGVAWICAKQLKHYPAFCRNSNSIAVHSFVFIMSEDEYNYLAYVEDMYEDKKRQKKVKVRWFYQCHEVQGLVPELGSEPREVFITPHVQVISAESIDSLATVLTPRHFEKCVPVVSHSSPSDIYVCSRQLKSNKVKPFTLTKLRGYSSQAILSLLDDPHISKQRRKSHKIIEDDNGESTHDDPVRVRSKRRRSCEEQEGTESESVVKASALEDPVMQGKTTYPKLKLKLSKKTMGIKLVLPRPQFSMSFNVGTNIELLSQDSGMRGCWFRCKVLKTSRKNLKVLYEDVLDVDESGNLEEWIPASRKAAPDKLGMRCPGRLTIRPYPPRDLRSCIPDVGAPVDAWWCDGWWEGVVARCDTLGNDGLLVYLPGESKLLTLERKNIRTSRDWIGNSWLDIKPKPDILSYISANVSPSTKISASAIIPEASGCGSTVSLDHKVPASDKLKAVEEKEQELLCTNVSLNNEEAKQVDLGNQSHLNNEIAVNECGDGGDRSVNDNADDIEENDDKAGNKAEPVLQKNVGFSYHKREDAQVTKVLA